MSRNGRFIILKSLDSPESMNTEQAWYLLEAVDGGSSLSDDVFVVFGVHGDLDVLHVGLQVFCLLLKGVTDLVSFLRGAINLDQVTLIQERDVGLSEWMNKIGFKS